jgi:hypothetical protein
VHLALLKPYTIRRNTPDVKVSGGPSTLAGIRTP